MRQVVFFSLVFLISCHQSNTPDRKGNTKEAFADHWKYVGVAVDEPGYTIWETAPGIIDR